MFPPYQRDSRSRPRRIAAWALGLSLIFLLTLAAVLTGLPR